MPEDRALIALQGPGAEAALAALWPDAAAMRFMDVAEVALRDIRVIVARAGYTGEDGFEISVPAEMADGLARALLDWPDVTPAGLGARDSLRLEAGLPLMGNDMGPETTPGEAGLGWSIPKIRRIGGAREGGFPGAERILPELASGPGHTSAGLRPEGRAPMRAGVTLYRDEASQTPVGHVTSGGYGPTVEAPVAIARLRADLCEPGLRVYGDVRGKRLPALVSPLPFIAPKYKR
jgi:aminomethyltransferase